MPSGPGEPFKILLGKKLCFPHQLAQVCCPYLCWSSVFAKFPYLIWGKCLQATNIHWLQPWRGYLQCLVSREALGGQGLWGWHLFYSFKSCSKSLGGIWETFYIQHLVMKVLHHNTIRGSTVGLLTRNLKLYEEGIKNSQLHALFQAPSQNGHSLKYYQSWKLLFAL